MSSVMVARLSDVSAEGLEHSRKHQKNGVLLPEGNQDAPQVSYPDIRKLENRQPIGPPARTHLATDR